jgi:hypothetical protein
MKKKQRFQNALGVGLVVAMSSAAAIALYPSPAKNSQTNVNHFTLAQPQELTHPRTVGEESFPP